MDYSILNEEQIRTRYIQQEILDILNTYHDICEKHNLKYILDYGTLLGAVRHEGFIPWDDDIDVAMPRRDFEKLKKIVQKELSGTKYFFQINDTDDKYFFPFAKIRKQDNRLRELAISHFDIVHGPWIDIFVYDYKIEDSFQLKNKVELINKKRRFIDYITPVIYDKEEPNQSAIKTLIKKIVIRVLNNPKNWMVYTFLDYKYERLKLAIESAIRDGNKDSKELISYSFLMTSLQEIRENTLPIDAFNDRIKLSFEGKKFYGPKNFDKVLRDRYKDYWKLPPIDKRTSGHLWDTRYFNEINK